MIQLLGTPDKMLTTIYRRLAELHLPTNLLCDHICYRVADAHRYENLQSGLKTYGELISEAVIGGRPISTFHLREPYRFQGNNIDCIELPSPKPGSSYPEGWEHAEFVTGEPLPVFIARHPHVAFKTTHINKAHNPDVSIAIAQGITAKFHAEPLLEVIRKEKALEL